MLEEKPFVVDEITLICKGCQGERKFVINPCIRSAEAFIAWMKTEATPCGCGATHCDVKAHMADQN